ncbi:uncharacterized protein LOC125240569 [Leguminivora glycinivorella]|uniref:uncharacterized protein LOC125240569 n=1 Tax=Leguminivora glycinivorella TaxID=1035111 RepID=UPI00200F6A6A|nr:uncharacterized protein LOC125240569 [Leguminivora glycinivorella]
MSLVKEEQSEDKFKSEKSSSFSTDSSSDTENEIKQVPEISKIKMSDKVTLSVLTKFIKPYNGDRESLPAFLTNCENAISLASTEQQNVLCKYIVSQLEGKAQLACCLKTFTSWAEIKSFLKTTFGEKKHSIHLLLELQKCKQLITESVTDYSLRVESCLTRILADIQYSCQDAKQLPGRIAAMEDLALNTFLLGLNPDFSHIVRSQNPSTLNEGISYAIEEEKIFNLNRSTLKTPKTCNVCRKPGHTSSECFHSKKERYSYYIKPRQHPDSFNRPPTNSDYPPNQFPNKPKVCAYCKNVGHTINECRKRQYINNMRLNGGGASNFASAANAGAQSSNTPGNQVNTHYCEVQLETNYDDHLN